MKRKIVSVILILIMLQAFVCSVFATSADLNAIDKKINDKKNEQAEVVQDLDEELKAISELDSQIDEMQDEIDELSSKIKSLETSIAEKEKEIKEKEKEYNDNEELLKQRLVVMYEAGEISFLDILFSSNNIIDFISNYYNVTQLIQYDTELLQSIENAKKEIENTKKELEEQKTEVESLKNDKVSKQNVIKNKKAQRQQKANALSDEKKALQAEIDKYNAERKQVEQEIIRRAQQAGSSAGGYVYTGGQLVWPCPGYSRITSYFGYRGSAATGGVGSSYHRGIDLGAAYGTAILAAAGGKVVYVYNSCSHNYGKTYSTRCSCGGGFGNYVQISHGGGLQTIYAHCTSILVSVGQTVSPGQQIATVGSTGYSTGAHLHFGVLLNGSYVNPASYLGM